MLHILHDGWIIYEQELNHSIWTLSSDSELSLNGSPAKENHVHGELSEHETFKLEHEEMDVDAVLIGSNEDPPSKKGLKISLKKDLELHDNPSIKEKKKGVSMKTEGVEQASD